MTQPKKKIFKISFVFFVLLLIFTRLSQPIAETWFKYQVTEQQKGTEFYDYPVKTITTYICYTTKYGHCYHAKGCQYLWNSSHKTTVYEATEAGYYDCSKCSPSEKTTFTITESRPQSVTKYVTVTKTPYFRVWLAGFIPLLLVYLILIIKPIRYLKSKQESVEPTVTYIIEKHYFSFFRILNSFTVKQSKEYRVHNSEICALFCTISSIATTSLPNLYFDQEIKNWFYQKCISLPYAKFEEDVNERIKFYTDVANGRNLHAICFPPVNFCEDPVCRCSVAFIDRFIYPEYVLDYEANISPPYSYYETAPLFKSLVRPLSNDLKKLYKEIYVL